MTENLETYHMKHETLREVFQVSSFKLCKNFFIAATLFFLGIFVPVTVRAASLYISPASGNFSVGSNFTVTVRTDSQGAAINTAEANIAFSADTLELVRVEASPTFYLQAPSSPAKGNGTAYFGGGLPSPGYIGGNGVVGTMTFRAIKEGTAAVSISSGKVLLNDGLGTEALSAAAGARYTVAKVPPPQPDESADLESPLVSSSSHPDVNSWYKEKTAVLSWSRPSGAYGFSFELSQDAETIPDNVLDTTITTTKTYADLADGIWYFHIKSRAQAPGSAFGQVSHFRIQIKTKPPPPPKIRLEEGVELAAVPGRLTIAIDTDDPLIDRYEVYVDEELVAVIPHNPYTLENLPPGPRVIRVVAIDKAGNTSEALLPVIVTAAPPALGFLAQSFTLPTYILILLNLLVVILLAVILRLALRRRALRDNLDEGISKLQKDVDKDLDKLKMQINRKLTRLLKKYGGDLSAEDLQSAETIKEGIAEAEEKIDTELTNLSEIKRQNKKSRKTAA